MSGANQEPFAAEDFAGTPLLRAVEQLCQETGRSLDSLESQPMGQIVEMAKLHYGAELPDIWRIWIDWNEGDQIQPMGDL